MHIFGKIEPSDSLQEMFEKSIPEDATGILFGDITIEVPDVSLLHVQWSRPDGSTDWAVFVVPAEVLKTFFELASKMTTT